MRPKKYTFIPEHQLNKESASSEFSVTINKTMLMYISAFDVEMYKLDGKTVRLYADVENKTIAWKEITHGNLKDLENVRQFKKGEQGQVVVGLNKILGRMGITKEMMPLKKIPVTEYKDTLVDGLFKVIDLRSRLPAKK